MKIKNRFTGKIILEIDSLRGANLQYADLRSANLQYPDLYGADLHGADLRGANFQGVNLHSADLRGANFQGANIDYSAWPLWCGSRGVKIDAKIAAQLAAHFCAVECDDKQYLKARKAILSFAKTSHRAKELELI